MSKTIDVINVKKDFPILQRRIHGKKLIYLDSAATSQKPRSVIEAISEYYSHHNANVHRGIHLLAEEATQIYEGARDVVKAFIRARKSKEIIFVRNATEAINLVAYSWGRTNIKKGDEILLTQMEHHSNLVPWQLLAKEKEAKLRFVPLIEKSFLDMGAYERLLGSKTKIVAVTQMSNVLGTINPIRKIVKKAHQAGAVVLVDGAQSVPHVSVDVQSLDCDFLAFSGHKMLGPTGIGVLYGKEKMLSSMPPFFGGGDMIKEVSFEHTAFNSLPWKFEAGTPNIADSAGLTAAISYLQNIGMESICEHEQKLTSYALDRLRQVKKLTIYGPDDATKKGGIIAFNLEGVHPHDLSTVLDQEGIAIRAGHHCAQPLLRTLGVVASARASLYLYNSEDDVDSLAESIEKAKKTFRVY